MTGINTVKSWGVFLFTNCLKKHLIDQMAFEKVSEKMGVLQ